jgi:hypothetical protein
MNRKLELLEFNHAGAMTLKDGRTVNYGVIELIEGKVRYYTGKGLREMWAQDMGTAQKQIAEALKRKSMQELIETEHVAITPLKDIDMVLF